MPAGPASVVTGGCVSPARCPWLCCWKQTPLPSAALPCAAPRHCSRFQLGSVQRPLHQFPSGWAGPGPTDKPVPRGALAAGAREGAGACGKRLARSRCLGPFSGTDTLHPRPAGLWLHRALWGGRVQGVPRCEGWQGGCRVYPGVTGGRMKGAPFVRVAGRVQGVWAEPGTGWTGLGPCAHHLPAADGCQCSAGLARALQGLLKAMAQGSSAGLALLPEGLSRCHGVRAPRAAVRSLPACL